MRLGRNQFNGASGLDRCRWGCCLRVACSGRVGNGLTRRTASVHSSRRNCSGPELRWAPDSQRLTSDLMADPNGGTCRAPCAGKSVRLKQRHLFCDTKTPRSSRPSDNPGGAMLHCARPRGVNRKMGVLLSKAPPPACHWRFGVRCGRYGLAGNDHFDVPFSRESVPVRNYTKSTKTSPRSQARTSLRLACGHCGHRKGYFPQQHFLNFLPLPQGHGSLRPTFGSRFC
jgi:hypothetical protein